MKPHIKNFIVTDCNYKLQIVIYYGALIFCLIWGGGECVGVCANAHLCAGACRVQTQLDRPVNEPSMYVWTSWQNNLSFYKAQTLL